MNIRPVRRLLHRWVRRPHTTNLPNAPDFPCGHLDSEHVNANVANGFEAHSRCDHELFNAIYQSARGAMCEFGGASQAARTLGMSVSAFNRVRLRVTYVYDPSSRTVAPLDPERDDLRAFVETKHLVAPSLAGTRLPGRPWTFRLDLLRHYQQNGWPGAEFPHPTEINEEKLGKISSRGADDD